MNELFSGLPMTMSSTSTTMDGRHFQVRLELLRGVLMLLQYDGNTIEHCNRAQQLCQELSGEERSCSSREEELLQEDELASSLPPHHHHCMIAYALQCQILASIGYPIDLKPLEHAVASSKEDSAYLLPWEQRHIAAVLMFCRERDFKRTVDLAVEALMLEPRDIFSLRLLFISVFFCGEYVAAHKALHQLVFAAVPGATDRKSYAEALQSMPVNLPIEHSLPLMFLPYVISYYAFTIEEMAQISGYDEHARSDYHAQIDEAEAWNDIAIELIHRLNIGRRSNQLLAMLPPFTHPYAMHVVCHVYESRGDPLGGIAAIENVFPRELWIGTAHLVVHCWWHVALFHLDALNITEALRVFDTYVMAAAVKFDPFGLSDVTAFLTRALMNGDLDPKNDPRYATIEALWEYHAGHPDRRITLTRFPFFHAHLFLTKWMVEDHSALQFLSGNLEHESTVPVVSALSNCLVRNSSLPIVVGDEEVDDGSRKMYAVNELLKVRASGWIEMGGSAAQRDILLRVCLYLVAHSLDSGSCAASLRSALKAIVQRIVEVFPKQPYYTNLWSRFVQQWREEADAGEL
ncbi:Hypothetical protein, putative [Bodo saltans]|uniref:Tetratricopeptide repeat protein 38 n=1 Tax=Bodo saltans TaxID=75058 RepID=A0A0S4KI87_BODSA|nr:Hypothetical protein, putative [Bodo saltans]|eukprot:CUI14153.1 Hypothetical protein, putative [Bodo saltans]